MKTKATPIPDQLFRALADPTRLRILNLLDAGELCVCHIVGALRMPQPKVSRHLAYLRRVGLVLARRDGLWIHYRLAPAASDFHQKVLESLVCCFHKDPAMSKDRGRLKPPKCC